MSEALNFIYNALDVFSGKETPEEAMTGLVDVIAQDREKARGGYRARETAASPHGRAAAPICMSEERTARITDRTMRRMMSEDQGYERERF